MPLSPSHRFVPVLESLEDRSLLSAVATASRGTLTIVNSGGLAVVDNGTNGAGNVTVFASGQAPMMFDAITHIVIDSVGSRDTIAYQLTGDLTGTRRVDVDLGTGKDSFIASLGGNLLARSQMLINVTGHNGQDTIQEAVAGNLFDRSALTFNANGSTAGNTITAVVTGTMFSNSANVLNVNGGPGNDTFLGLFLGAMLNGSSTQWTVNGGAGSDILGAYVSTQLSSSASFRLLFAGTASDVINVGADNMVVAPGAFLSIGLVGGNGSNSMSDFFRGVLQGAVVQVAVGGNGRDVIQQQTLLDPGSTTLGGGIASFVEGSGGDDNLLEVVRPSSLRQGVNAVLDGGSGFNIARVNRPVHVRNCQVILSV
jgi:hypothetical protein